MNITKLIHGQTRAKNWLSNLLELSNASTQSLNLLLVCVNLLQFGSVIRGSSHARLERARLLLLLHLDILDFTPELINFMHLKREAKKAEQPQEVELRSLKIMRLRAVALEEGDAKR